MVVPSMVVVMVMAVGSPPAGLAAATSTCGASGAVVGLAVGVGRRIRGGIVRRRLPGFTRLVVDAAHLRRLLAHALVVDNILSPLDMALLRRLSSETQRARWCCKSQHCLRLAA